MGRDDRGEEGGYICILGRERGSDKRSKGGLQLAAASIRGLCAVKKTAGRLLRFRDSKRLKFTEQTPSTHVA